MSNAAQEFLRSAAEKSAELAHRQLIRNATDTYNTANERGRARFADWEAARLRCQEIKWEAVNNMDRYLQEFEQRVKDRGGIVFWAENSEEARKYITDLATARGVRKVAKSKSMVSEEIHLGPALEKLGIKVVETDLGEYIVQLREETPYHIVTPAMHLNRTQIAALFKEKLGDVDSDDPQQLVAAARRALRRDFFFADMGISGANFLVADAGMIALTTNEGNGRLCTSVPRIHVVLSGIEKVIPRLQDLATLWPVLATAGTGQAITCYSTLAGGPRQANEVDGPEEFHVVLVDNGRSELLANVEEREVLHCIRCGACINACPVFRTVGGHTYGTTYMGPIGSVLTPHLRGLKEFQHLSYASSLCGACTDVCPVKIDLHHHLLHNRRDAVNASDRPWSERMGFAVWSWAVADAGRFKRVGWLARVGMRVMHKLGLDGTLLDPARPWNRNHAAPQAPAKSFRELWGKQSGNN
ncbi:MAG: LutB/LldF family L-lactate oxidation iron-sulfur protein [Candidatus Acidiferrales bacterium]